LKLENLRESGRFRRQVFPLSKPEPIELAYFFKGMIEKLILVSCINFGNQTLICAWILVLGNQEKKYGDNKIYFARQAANAETDKCEGY